MFNDTKRLNYNHSNYHALAFAYTTMGWSRFVENGNADYVDFMPLSDSVDCVEIIKTISVAHVGWDMDDLVWLVKDSSGQLVLYGTSHGSLIKLDRSYLESKIAEYRQLIDDSLTIISLIQEG